MSEEVRISKKTGKPVDSRKGWHGASDGHSRAGKIGGAKVSEDREHMAELGRRGGATVFAKYGKGHMANIGRKGGSRVSENREHMAEIGKKGGESKS